MTSRRAIPLSALLALLSTAAHAAEPGFVWGVKASAGGRYDNVRMVIGGKLEAAMRWGD